MSDAPNTATHGAASAAPFFSTTPRNTMNFTTHNTDTSIEIGGTSLQGYVDATYEELTNLFGKPTDGDGYKVDAEWIIRFGDGTIATIYNWKNGTNYCGENGKPVEKITDWHVGGKDKGSVTQVQIALDLMREVAEAEKPKDKIEQALGSAKEIMDSIRATRGDAYFTAVEIALMVRKQTELVHILSEMAVNGAELPKPVGQMLMDMHGHMSARILARSVKVVLPGSDKNLNLAEELMGWVDRVMDAEGTGVKQMLKEAGE